MGSGGEGQKDDTLNDEETGYHVVERSTSYPGEEEKDAAVSTPLVAESATMPLDFPESGQEVKVMIWWLIFLVLAMVVHLTVCVVVMYLSEDWTLTTAIYFSLVTITTVGYGQFVPSGTGAKLYIIFFVLTGIFLCGVFVSVIQMKVTDWMVVRRTQLSRWSILFVPLALTTFWFALYSTILIYMDDLSVVDAWYFVVISFSTVGYGDVLLRDESSRGVGIFFLLSGTALFAYLLATVVTLATIEFKMMSCHSYFAKPVTKQRLMQMDTTGSGDISRAEFMEHCLLACNLVDPELISQINSSFDQLATKDGVEAPPMAPRAVLNMSHAQTAIHGKLM